MNQTPLLEKELEEISKQIDNLEKQELSEDNNWGKKISYGYFGKNGPDKQTLLARKVIGKSLENDIKRKLELLKRQGKSHSFLISKFFSKLSQIEGNIGKLEVRIDEFIAKEENLKVRKYFFMAIAIVLIVFSLYMFATSKGKLNS